MYYYIGKQDNELMIYRSFMNIQTKIENDKSQNVGDKSR